MRAIADRRTKVFGTAILALPILAVVLGEIQVARATHREYRRRVAAQVEMPERLAQRLAPLQSVLPAYGRIGYIDPDHSWLNATSTRTFYLTQFVLAPRVLVYSTEPDLVLYSSHTGRPLTSVAIPDDLHVLAEVAPDLVLLVRGRQ